MIHAVIHSKASPEVILNAYRALAKKYHPDIYSDKNTAHKVMSQINEAYSVLSDPNKRQNYDEDIFNKTDKLSQEKPTNQPNNKNITPEMQQFSIARLKEIIYTYFREPKFIIGLVIICFLAFNLFNQPKVTSNQSIPQVQQTPPSFVPKSGVLTQYVPNEPIYNNHGHCELIIDNTNNDFPVTVRLWSIFPNARPVRSFTIKAKETFTAKNLTPGRYEIKYMHLYDNIQSADAFKSEQFDLAQRKNSKGTSYDILTLTLYKVNNGNTQTYRIDTNEL
jgi:curved DNA-binding protein CbpA